MSELKKIVLDSLDAIQHRCKSMDMVRHVVQEVECDEQLVCAMVNAIEMLGKQNKELTNAIIVGRPKDHKFNLPI